MKQLSRVESIIFLVGGLLMVIGAGTSLLAWEAAPYVFALGALCFTAMQMKQRYDGPNVTIRRLRRMMLISDVLFLVSALLMFDYYSYENLKSKAIDLYNCALAVEEKYLNRFEFYRLLLNSNKKLAAFYASTSTNTVNASDMAKWVLETADRTISNPKPYPILKAQGKYPSIINYDVEHAPASTSIGRNHGGKLGKTLKIHLSGTGITTDFLEIDRTDKDFDRFNYNYDKIQLPYFNDVGTGNYTDNKVVTGWKITKMDGGTAGTFTAADEWDGYNFADRKCTNTRQGSKGC